MSFVKLLEDVAAMMPIKTNLKGVLDFIGVFDLSFLFIKEIWHNVKMSQDLPWDQCLAKNFHYLQLLFTSSICFLISDVIIPNVFKEFAFVVLTFPSFLPKMHVLLVLCTLMSLRSVRYHRRKPCNFLNEKVRYVPNSLTQ